MNPVVEVLAAVLFERDHRCCSDKWPEANERDRGEYLAEAEQISRDSPTLNIAWSRVVAGAEAKARDDLAKELSRRGQEALVGLIADLVRVS